MTSIQSSTFLRRVLSIDALSSGAMSIALLAFAGPLADLLQLPVELISEAGMVLVPFALFVGYLASRAQVARAAVWALIAMNVVWVVDSVLLLLTGWVEPNVLGYLFVGGQAAFVAVLVDLEYVGLRKSAQIQAAAA
jgi:hypothetical protein